MSMYLLPEIVLKRLDKGRRRIFWQGNGLKRKYHLVKWDKVCRPKKKGGLGIKDLRKLNLSLLCKWSWVLVIQEGIWLDLVRLKYINQKPLYLVPNRKNDSPVWSDLLKVRHIYLKRRTFRVNNGKLVSFWLGIWLDDIPMCQSYPVLYELCLNQTSSVYEVWMGTNGLYDLG
jgi:hypothetical protein